MPDERETKELRDTVDRLRSLNKQLAKNNRGLARELEAAIARAQRAEAELVVVLDGQDQL